MDSNEAVEQARRRTRIIMKSITGEIIQVQGGHIVRSTGRKDRHSKVFTAKGPRDRRVRLSAHTAIQFYDVQDRLGYDRPSKAVDWLIKKAKSAIDKLSEVSNSDLNGKETDIVADRFSDFELHGQLLQNSIPPPVDSVNNFQSYQNLALSLQTQNSEENDETVLYTAGSGNSGLGFDDSYERMVAWNNVFGLPPFLNPTPPHKVANYAWNDLSIASGGYGQKFHQIHEQSSVLSTRFISGELPGFDSPASPTSFL